MMSGGGCANAAEGGAIVRRIALAGAVLMFGLTACGTASHGWSGPMTDVKCSYAGKQANLFMVMHFAPGAATNSPLVTPNDLAVEPGYKVIMSQPDPSSAARQRPTVGAAASRHPSRRPVRLRSDR